MWPQSMSFACTCSKVYWKLWTCSYCPYLISAHNHTASWVVDIYCLLQHIGVKDEAALYCEMCSNTLYYTWNDKHLNTHNKCLHKTFQCFYLFIDKQQDHVCHLVFFIIESRYNSQYTSFITIVFPNLSTFNKERKIITQQLQLWQKKACF